MSISPQPSRPETRRVSISAALPESLIRNGSDHPLQSRPLTPYRRIGNSYMHFIPTPHNSYAPDCDKVAASPLQIGGRSLYQGGASHIRASLLDQRLRSFHKQMNQENTSIEEGHNGKTTPPYQSRGNTPTSIRQITKRLAEEKFERGDSEGLVHSGTLSMVRRAYADLAPGAQKEEFIAGQKDTRGEPRRPPTGESLLCELLPTDERGTDPSKLECVRGISPCTPFDEGKDLSLEQQYEST